MRANSRPSPFGPQALRAVCFDYRGVILDHRTDDTILPGMERLLKTLKGKGLKLALISRFPVEVLKGRLGSIQEFFGLNIYSGGGRGKLDCIREFAADCGLDEIAGIAFVDDKPDNILPVAEESNVFVVGFRGSGKYPEARDICREQGICYAEDVKELEGLLVKKPG